MRISPIFLFRSQFLGILIILLAVNISSCRRDYPRDIPDWLKDKIKELKKETKGINGCRYYICMTIDEYTDGSNTTFWFQPGGTPVGYKVYDYYGNEQCYFETVTPNNCGGINNLQSFYFKRRIWSEDN